MQPVDDDFKIEGITKKRSLERVKALEALYEIDVTGKSPEEVFEERESYPLSGEFTPFSRMLVESVISDLKTIDEQIERYSKGWKIDRIGNVERNVMRVALAEMLIIKDVPFAVAIDEAVTIVRAYAGEESRKFVNGILGSIARNLSAESRIADE